MEDSMDAGNAKYFRTPMSIKELVLRAGQRKISEINMFLENKQKPSSIPKINPQLLYMEIKSKIPKFDQISNMSFTRNGKLRFATSDPVCAIQILSLDQLFNISINASVIWEGITSRFLLYEIPTNVSLEELSAELQDSNNFAIVEIRRFIKSAEKQIMELKCRQHVTLSEARRRFRASNSENLSTVLKSKSQENNIQELIDKKFEKMMTAFQTVVEKQTAFLMEILQKSMETMLSQILSSFLAILTCITRCGDRITAQGIVIFFIDWFTDSNSILLNTTVPTYRNSTGKTSLIDLTICSSSLYGHTNCYVSDVSLTVTILQYITQPQIQANIFADFFASKNAYHEPIPLEFFHKEDNNLNKPFHIFEIHRAIKLSKNSTPGADHITASFLKNLDRNGCEIILRYFQDLFDNAIVPNSWKHAVILPIPKQSEDKTRISSYRPIALTSIFSKTFERVLTNRLSYFLTTERKLHPQHYGFVPFKDSRSATYLIHKAIMDAKLKKKYFVGDKSLPVQIIRGLFDETVNRNFQDFYIIATDASKNEQITSIAGITANSYFAYRINHNNSIFTAEALAICQALDDLSIMNKNLLILSDSLFVFSALQNYSIKSHSVIHKLASKIYILSLYNNQLILLWTPGHSNILWNEQADNLARTVTESNVYIDWISSEDINQKIYQESFKKANDNFYSSKYFVNLGNIPNISTISKWTRNRREEILCTESSANDHHSRTST
ncbi:uncharacterized protein TNCV_2780621 [Trichonephila clavipes]|nr:uncharacterized protein TNCV_2780621 [Trichonephila clavipes]